MDSTAQFFVGSRSLSGFVLLDAGDDLILEHYNTLVDIVAKHCGSQVAGLFAEPHISYGNGKSPTRIDWYTRYDGVARPLRDLDPSSVQVVQRTLAIRLAALRPLTFDPQFGRLVTAALNLSGPSAILSVGGEPLLIDWGMLPQTALVGSVQHTRHFEETLGPYLADFQITAPFQTEDLPPNDGKTMDRSDAAAKHGRNPVLSPETRSSLRLMRAPTLGIFIVAILLGLVWNSDTIGFIHKTPSSNVLATARQVIHHLEIESERLDQALESDCPTLVKINTTTSMVPPRLDSVRVPTRPGIEASSASESTSTTSLVSRADEGTVLVISRNGTGSGFFISPDTIVTNQHVVDDDNRVRIANKVIGIIEAQVTSHGDHTTSGINSQDLAILKVTPQAKAKPFTISTSAPPLQQIVAVGYPGVAMQTDPTFQRLMQGDATASAHLSAVMTAGQINHLQHLESGTTLIVHSAEISHGNSGGPLIDLCGRVVGINTFGLNDETVMWRYALGADSILSFAARSGVDIGSTAQSCSPTTQSDSNPSVPTSQAKR